MTLVVLEMAVLSLLETLVVLEDQDPLRDSLDVDLGLVLDLVLVWKALQQDMFSEQHLVKFDQVEYIDTDDVSRLQAY